MAKAKVTTKTGEQITVVLNDEWEFASLYGAQVILDGEVIGYVRKVEISTPLTHGSIAYASTKSTEWKTYGVDRKQVGYYNRTRSSALSRLVASL